MKLKYYFLVIAIVILIKNNSFAELRLAGCYVNDKNDTIKALFFVPYGIQLNVYDPSRPTNIDITLDIDTIDFINLTFSTTIILENGKWKKLKAKNIKSFWFTFKNDEYKFVSFRTDSIGYKDPNGRFVPNIFLRELSTGKCNLYCYYEKVFNPTGVVNINGFSQTIGYNLLGKNYYLKKTNQTIIELFDEVRFEYELVEYFDNCTTLADWLNKKNVKRRDIKLIVDKYNESCN